MQEELREELVLRERERELRKLEMIDCSVFGGCITEGVVNLQGENETTGGEKREDWDMHRKKRNQEEMEREV